MPASDRPPSRAPRLSREQRRTQLLDVTKRIVGASGLHGVSIDRVAREAGISRPIVYEHFGDLGGLLHALFDREGARALAQLESLLPDTPTGGPIDRVLISMLGAYLDAVRADPVTWRLMLMPAEGTPDFLQARVDEARRTVVELLAGLLGPDTGASTPDPLLTAASMQGLAEHWARLTLQSPETFDRDRIVRLAEWLLAPFAR